MGPKSVLRRSKNYEAYSIPSLPTCGRHSKDPRRLLYPLPAGLWSMFKCSDANSSARAAQNFSDIFHFLLFFHKKGRAQRGFFFRYLPCPTILLMKKAARSAEILVHDAQNLGPCLEPLCCLFHPLKKFSKNCQEMLKNDAQKLSDA